MNDLPDAIGQLTERMKALERRAEALESRVDALEHPLAARWPKPLHGAEAAAAEPLPAAGPAVESGSWFPVLGKALLGIAGAYVLRAVEETGSLPRLMVAAAGIVYAFLWLIWAARAHRGPRFSASLYAATSALILAPMLWELTLRFNVLPAADAAAVVCVYALASQALARARKRKSVLRVGLIAAAALAFALAMASHALLPFVVVLLILAAVGQFVPGCDGVPEGSLLIALAADALIWILIYVYFAGQGSHEGYPTLSHAALLAPGIAVFLLFGAGAAVKTTLRGHGITVFETVQTMIAFLLAAVSLADFGQPAGRVILGAACLALCAACYAAVFTVFARAAGRRNETVFAAWAALLLLAGSLLCLPSWLLVLLLDAAALGAVVLGRQARWAVFEFYGIAFLLAAATASGLLRFIVSALAGTPAGMPPAVQWLVASAAVLCFAFAKPRAGEGRIWQVVRFGFAALTAGAVASVLVEGLVALTALRVMPGAHHLALIRTVALCAEALALVFGGARWQRPELTRLAYTVLALVAVKLVAEDLRHGHLAYIAGSIFLVALTLMAAPRLARARLKT